MKICLDPGHGQYGNPGYIKGYYEGTQMFKLAYIQKQLLEQYQNVQVVVTRKVITDDPSLLARGQAATNFDLFISDHSNAPGSVSQTEVTGTEVYDTVAKPNKALGDALGKAVVAVMAHPFRGTNYRKNSTGIDWYGVLRYASAAGCKSSFIIEHGFHTNPKDCAFLYDDRNLLKIAQAEVAVIASFYHLVKEGEDVAVKLNEKGQAVYNYQIICKKLGAGIGTYADMVDGTATGCDGSYGPTMLKVTNDFERKYGLPVTADGLVSNALCNKLNIELQKQTTGVPQAQYDAVVVQRDVAVTQRDAAAKQRDDKEAELVKYAAGVTSLLELERLH